MVGVSPWPTTMMMFCPNLSQKTFNYFRSNINVINENNGKATILFMLQTSNDAAMEIRRSTNIKYMHKINKQWCQTKACFFIHFHQSPISATTNRTNIILVCIFVSHTNIAMQSTFLFTSFSDAYPLPISLWQSQKNGAHIYWMCFLSSADFHNMQNETVWCGLWWPTAIRCSHCTDVGVIDVLLYR